MVVSLPDCCARGERPEESRAAQRPYEFAPSNIDCHLTAPQKGHADWNAGNSTTP